MAAPRKYSDDREFPSVWFERYADDAVLHCVTERQAREVLAALTDRMVEVGLQLHPDKTRIVYCKDGHRRGSGFVHEPRSATAKASPARVRVAHGPDRILGWIRDPRVAVGAHSL
ncbi:reverse transcriptase domain-containing protein [Streptomyces sp. NPDC088124]|uniref:reverse transcriptase domain-containing protein n=1 Tax=Streptomyces sp. NPDC088124 TaxID=3154654 RepID=UPI00341706BB